MSKIIVLSRHRLFFQTIRTYGVHNLVKHCQPMPCESQYAGYAWKPRKRLFSKTSFSQVASESEKPRKRLRTKTSPTIACARTSLREVIALRFTFYRTSPRWFHALTSKKNIIWCAICMVFFWDRSCVQEIKKTSPAHVFTAHDNMPFMNSANILDGLLGSLCSLSLAGGS